MHDRGHRQAIQFLTCASGYEDPGALEQAFALALESLGVEAFSCARQDARRPGGPPLVLAQRGLAAWDQYMADQGYFAVNPSVRSTALGRPAYTWGELKGEARRAGAGPAREARLWAEAADAGLRDGLVVRTVAPGGQVLSTRMVTGAARIRQADRALLESLAIVFATLRHRFHERAADAPLNAILTRREAECLRWAAHGLHDYEIAERLGISGNTVRNHMQNAMRKLGAPSRLAAYYRALSLGALD